MMMIKCQTLKKSNGMMMVKWKMIPPVKLSVEQIKKKSNKKFRIAADEDIDDRSESCKSDNSRFSQTSSIKQQDEESSSVTAIDHSIKKHKHKNPKEDDQIKGKDMAMLVFNPCIMVFSPLFNVIMLTLTILTRRP